MLFIASSIPEKERRSLTPWELPSLLAPVHTYRRSHKKVGKERAHFAAILAFVHRNRLAVSSQVQRRFKNVLRSDRTTRRHLEELQSLGYLGVAPGRGVGPLFPKVYYVTGRGVRRLKETLSKRGKPWQESRIDRRSRDSQEGYAADRIIHEILITEFLVAVWQTIEGRADLELLSVQRRSSAKHPAFRLAIANRPTRLVPDAMFLFRQKGAGMRCCFLELDNGTMNTKQIRAKYARYAAWSQSAAGQQYLIDLYRRHGAKEPRPTFRLLVVARSRTGERDENRLCELQKPIAELPMPMKGRVRLTTVDDLRRLQSDSRPLGAAICASQMSLQTRPHGRHNYIICFRRHRAEPTSVAGVSRTERRTASIAIQLPADARVSGCRDELTQVGLRPQRFLARSSLRSEGPVGGSCLSPLVNFIVSEEFPESGAARVKDCFLTICD